MFVLRTLGGLAIEGPDGRPLATGAQRRALALLAFIGSRGARGIGRDKLLAAFWPNSDEDHARNALRQTLFRVRRDLRSDEIVIGEGDLRLNTEVITTDAAAFEEAVSAHRLQDAVGLYGGAYLDGVHVPDASSFEQWSDAERERLARVYKDALVTLAREASSAGSEGDAIRWWQQAAVADPFDDAVATGYLQSLAASGDIAGALRHAKVHETLLQLELGAEPGPEHRALVQRLRTRAEAAPANPSEPSSRDARASVGSSVESTQPPAIVVEVVGAPPAVVDSPPGPGWGWLRNRVGVISVMAAGLTALAVYVAVTRSASAPALDPTLVAVAPFEILTTGGSGMGLWREGMVDVLSHALDGAGPLRTVPAGGVLRHWSGSADEESAIALGRATGAGLAVYGSLVAAGPDSVRLTASIVDVRSRHVLTDVIRRDATSRMDRLTDAVAVGLITAIEGYQPVRAVRTTVAASGGLTTTSLEALKAYLQGEQLFRRAQWHAARDAFARAVTLDSTSPLALHRLGMVSSWERLLQDSVTSAYLLRAGALNHGLGPRDSLLVAADSLAAAANAATGNLAAWRPTRRLFATLEGAARLYPDDPEVWFALGEARYHFGFGPGVGVPERETLSAFQRAIALDSAFAPAYLHAPELELNVAGAPAALRVARAYLALHPTEAVHGGVRLVVALLESSGDESDVLRLADTAQTSALVSARTILRRWPDPAERAVQLGRLLAQGRPSPYALFSDTAFMRNRLAQELAFRGHLAEAYALSGRRTSVIFSELALLGAVPADVAAREFRRALTSGEVAECRRALSWWAGRHDSSAIREFGKLSSARIAHMTAGDAREEAQYDTSVASAYLALARGDTAHATERFMALPDSLCAECYVDRLTRGRQLMRLGRYREALASLGESPSAFLTPVEVLFALERARAAVRMGDAAQSRAAYTFVAAAWHGADTTLRPIVDEARRAAR